MGNDDWISDNFDIQGLYETLCPGIMWDPFLYLFIEKPYEFGDKFGVQVKFGVQFVR